MSIFEEYGWWITSDYGWRTHPITGKAHRHRGIDMAQSHQHPVRAWMGGTVLFAGHTQDGTGLGGYGNVVALKDEDGYLHIYAHLDSVSVWRGDRVPKGYVVGYQGSTGVSTASHLHYEIREQVSPSYGWDTDINPTEYLESALNYARWKYEGINKLADEGLLNDIDYWKDRIDEPMPVWAAFILLARLYKEGCK